MTKEIKKFLIDFLIIIFSLVSSIIVLLYNTNESYKLMFILPLVFLISYLLFLRKGINHFLEFNIVYTIINLIRFCILPILIIITKLYDGRSPIPPSIGSFDKAFILMSIEIILCGFLIFLLSNLKYFKFKDKKERMLSFSNRTIIYYIFILLTLGLSILNTDIFKAFSFIKPNSYNYSYENFDLFSQIILLSLVTAKQLFFLLLCSKFYKKYSIKNNKLYIYLSFMSMLINCFIFVGVNRSDFLLNLISSFLILFYMYGKLSKKFIKVFGVIGLVSLVLISQARNYRSVSNGKNYLYDTADNIQIYMAGPYDVAIAVEMAKDYSDARNIEHLIFDFGRSTLGLNVLFKNTNLVNTNKYYNMRLYKTDQSTQILPIIGEGYFFFGMFFSPILEFFFIIIAYLLKKGLENNNKIELVFFYTITIIRIGFVSCQNASIQMNDLSFNLFLPLILYYLNNRIYIKRGGV